MKKIADHDMSKVAETKLKMHIIPIGNREKVEIL